MLPSFVIASFLTSFRSFRPRNLDRQSRLGRLPSFTEFFSLSLSLIIIGPFSRRSASNEIALVVALLIFFRVFSPTRCHLAVENSHRLASPSVGTRALSPRAATWRRSDQAVAGMPGIPDASVGILGILCAWLRHLSWIRGKEHIFWRLFSMIA